MIDGINTYQEYTSNRLGKGYQKHMENPASYILRSKDSNERSRPYSPESKYNMFNVMYGTSMPSTKNFFKRSKLDISKMKARSILTSSLEYFLSSKNVDIVKLKRFNMHEKYVLTDHLRKLENAVELVKSINPKPGACVTTFQDTFRREILHNISYIKRQLESNYISMLIKTEGNILISEEMFTNFQHMSTIYRETIGLLIPSLYKAKMMFDAGNEKALAECAKEIRDIKFELSSLNNTLPYVNLM